MSKKVTLGENKTSDGYKEGAIAGGLAGFVIAAYLRKNIVLGAVIGLMAGGYIGYLAKTDNSYKTEFKKI